MKKITYYFSMIFMAVMMLSLTSCDEDADIAYALNGNWKGYMQTQLDYDGRVDIGLNAKREDGRL